MVELTVEKKEELSRLRNQMMSPYIAQDWEILADYPTERRVILSKDDKFSWGWFIFLSLISYFVFGIIYAVVHACTSTKKKTLMY